MKGAKLTACLAALLLCWSSGAQVLRDKWSHEVSAGGGYCTNENFTIELSYFYFPFSFKYIGFGSYLGMHASTKDREVPYGPVKSTTDFNEWILTSSHTKVTGLTLTPSVLLETPALKIHALKISLRAIPGMNLTIPRERVEAEFREVKADKPVDFSNYKYQYFWLSGNQWVSWSGRFTLHFAIDELCFGLGYSMSNYDIWSTRRNGNIEGTSFSEFYPQQRPLYHYFFVYTAWKF